MADQITDHVAAALARQKQQYIGKPKVEAWIEILVTPVQRLEDALYALIIERTIDTAIGDQLDVIGALVGQARDGRSDADYRRFIRATITSNKASGLIEDVITVSRLVLDLGDTGYVVERQGTAAMRLRVDAGAVSDAVAEILARFLRKTAGGGVRMLVEYSTVAPADSFYWDTTDWDDGLEWWSALE